MKLYFITGNANKFAEAKQLLPNIEQIKLNLTEIQSLDPRVIIEHKLKEAAKHHPGSYIVEDSSVWLASLNGFPGPYIKHMEEKIGNDGIARLAIALNNTNVRALCTIGYINESDVQFFEGELHGNIVEPRGSNGFGWDTIFMPEGFNITMAEMTPEQKNKISMRYIALEKLKQYMKQHDAGTPSKSNSD